MHLSRASLVLLLLSCAQAQSILGFTPYNSSRETEIETKFKSIPTPDEERRQHRIFTARAAPRRLETQQRTRRLHRRPVAQPGI